MKTKKIFKKAKIAYRIILNEGVLSLLIAALVYIQKRKANKTNLHGQQIPFKVKYRDAVAINLDKDYYPKWTGTLKKKLEINWIMPPPGKGSGGHLNIFRFIKYLEEAGHKNRIYLYAEVSTNTPIPLIKEVMGDSFPKVQSEMFWLDEPDEMHKADVIFCTSWETAYASKNSKMKAKRFYFVQDFEPYFYPLGSLYSLAENTYKFGFHGITAGSWISKKLSKEYGMKTDFYEFGADSNTYSLTNNKKRKEIFFYARPYTERRGFEMGILALDIFHRKHPDIVINFAGWDTSSYDIPFPYKNLKTLEIDELSNLYNNCAAALVMSYTNMSLLPLELLACGTIPVVNKAENNTMVSNNPFIAYSNNTPKDIADKLSEIVRRKDSADYAELASRSVKINSWDESGKKFLNIVEREVKNRG